MEELVKFIVKNIVSNPDDVKVTSEEESETVTLVHVNVNASDVGKIIGKNGRVVSALRTIVKSLSAKTGKRYILKIDDKK